VSFRRNSGMAVKYKIIAFAKNCPERGLAG
jgi:hypothetical protein